MSMDIYAIVIFCIVCALLSLVLRQYRPEFALVLSMSCSVLVILYLTDSLLEIRSDLERVLSQASISAGLLTIIFKGLGICILTELASQSCKDAGEGAIALKVEFAGKVGLALVSLPLFYELLETVSQLLNI